MRTACLGRAKHDGTQGATGDIGQDATSELRQGSDYVPCIILYGGVRLQGGRPPLFTLLRKPLHLISKIIRAQFARDSPNRSNDIFSGIFATFFQICSKGFPKSWLILPDFPKGFGRGEHTGQPVRIVTGKGGILFALLRPKDKRLIL